MVKSLVLGEPFKVNLDNTRETNAKEQLYKQ